MKLKTLAAAAAVLCSAHAFAGINTEDGNAELFLVVWDEAKATYILDTGFKLGTLTSADAGSTPFSLAASANFSSFKAEDGDLNDFAPFTGTRWALFAVDNNDQFNFDRKDRNYLTTTSWDLPLPASTERVNQTMELMADYTLTLGQNGLTPNPAVNGDMWVKIGSPAHFIESGYGGAVGIFAGNAIGGGTQKLSFCSWDLSMDAPDCTTQNSKGLFMQASFDGTTLNVVTNPIPEPGTYLMLLAGLATVGFMARRRKA